MKLRNFKIFWAEDRKGTRNLIVIHKSRQYLFAKTTDFLDFLFEHGASVKDRVKAGAYANKIFRLKGEVKKKC